MCVYVYILHYITKLECILDHSTLMQRITVIESTDVLCPELTKPIFADLPSYWPISIDLSNLLYDMIWYIYIYIYDIIYVHIYLAYLNISLPVYHCLSIYLGYPIFLMIGKGTFQSRVSSRKKTDGKWWNNNYAFKVKILPNNTWWTIN